jgi:hypothetical protein
MTSISAISMTNLTGRRGSDRFERVQGDEKRFGPASTPSMERLPFPCHPDRSEAQRRDLRCASTSSQIRLRTKQPNPQSQRRPRASFAYRQRSLLLDIPFAQLIERLHDIEGHFWTGSI